jgi:alpha-glucoside transport system substrate-binding protein
MSEVVARRYSRVVALGLGALFLLAACGGGGGGGTSGGASSTDVTVWTAWGGQELKAFQDVLKPFHDQTGITVHLSTVRDASQLAINVDAGTTLPDIGLPPTIDKVQSWVSKGVMKPVEDALGDQFQAYVTNTVPSLTTSSSGNTNLQIYLVNGKHYGLFVKTQVKGLFWYNTKVFTGQAPKTWNDLLAVSPSQYSASKLFCTGLESGAASGWPGVDAFDNILMRQAGHQTYNDLIAGKVKWSDPKIKAAYQSLGQMFTNSFGGKNTILTTNFGKAGDPMFKSPPGCLFIEQATFITNFFQQDNPGITASSYNFFPHPSMGNADGDGNVNGFADSLVMYNNTPAARKLMQWVASKDAQQIWVNDGGTLAANKQVTYPDPISKAAFAVVQGAKNLEVTAGDFVPSDMQTAFWKSMLDYVNDPSSLDSILAHLDQVQHSAYSS